MAQLIWTRESENWLRDIYDYIAQDNASAASNVINGIFKKAQLLLEQPALGYIYEHESNKTIRILLYGHYRITYVIEKEVDIIILGVFHGALQIEDYLIL